MGNERRRHEDARRKEATDDPEEVQRERPKGATARRTKKGRESRKWSRRPRQE